MDPLRVAFIGAGGIARRQMGLLKGVPGVQIVAAADTYEGSLKSAVDETGISHVYSDYQRMLAQHPEVDAVSVCTPNAFHAKHTMDSLQAGKHVLVEKPMAMNATEAAAMVESARQAKRQLIIGFQYRFEPRTVAIRKQIAGGYLGKIMYVRAQSLRRRGIPNWGQFGRKEVQGGGAMIDVGVHVLESAHYLIGAPEPVSATANAWTYMGNKASDVLSMWPDWDYKTYTVEDLAVAMVRFETGAMMTIETSFVAHIREDVWNINILGERGGANWQAPEIYKDDAGYMMNMQPSYLGEWEAWTYKMKHFVEVCRDGRRNESPGEHGLMVQRILDGIYASAATGQEVKV